MCHELLRIGPLAIHAYGVMMALGFVAGFVNWVVLGRREGRSVEQISDLMLWMMVAGIVGSRAAYVLSDFRAFIEAPMNILRVDQGGLVFYGGFLAAWAVLVFRARRQREPFWKLADFAVTSVPLAHAFGRIGCWLNGCCYGAVTNSPLAIRYPAGSFAWHDQVTSGLLPPSSATSLPVYPVQLFESLYNLVVFAILVLAYRRKQRHGAVCALYLLLYPPGRFVLEFLRGEQRLFVGGVSDAQWLSLGLMAAGGVLLWKVMRPARARKA